MTSSTRWGAIGIHKEVDTPVEMAPPVQVLEVCMFGGVTLDLLSPIVEIT